MDEDGDGDVEVLLATPNMDLTIRGSVGVASFGPDPANTNKRVYSWKPVPVPGRRDCASAA